jgi:hypothetical protein
MEDLPFKIVRMQALEFPDLQGGVREGAVLIILKSKEEI